MYRSDDVHPNLYLLSPVTLVEIAISFLDGVENDVEKRENAGFQHCLLFQQYFQNLSFLVSLKVKTVWQGINQSLILKGGSRFLSKIPLKVKKMYIWSALVLFSPNYFNIG